MDDPKTVVDAVLGEGGSQAIGIYPVTIRRYALLERLGSPFIDPSKDFSVDSVVPTAFVMTRDAKELRKWCSAKPDDVRDAAFEWSDGLEVSDVPELVSRISDQFLALQKAAPQTGGGKKNPEDEPAEKST